MKPRLLQLFRLAILTMAVWLIHASVPVSLPAGTAPPNMEAVRVWFPHAARLAPARPPRFAWPVENAAGQLLGRVLRTAPQTDALIGYAGPNDLLIAESPNGTILGLTILQSGDTPGHTAQVKAHPSFTQSFNGWNPDTSPPPRIEAVSGATLTSLAMAEAVLQRLGSPSTSLRFPHPVSLAEAQSLFPGTTRFDDRTAFGASDAVLGHLLRTSPASDNVMGYSGPAECLIALLPDGRTVHEVRLRHSYDTPDYVDQVRDDYLYLRSFKGRTLPQLAGLDYQKEGIEGVSGATMTSYAVAEGLKRRAALELRPPAPPAPAFWKARDTLLVLVIGGALLMAFTGLRGKPWIRWVWQTLLIGYFGWISADLLSLGLFTGWARHGPPWQSAPGLMLLAAAALLVPWATGRQLYCHQICPHGAMQLWLGKLTKKKLPVPPRLNRLLERLPGALLILAFIAALGIIPLNNAHLEAFDAWAWRAAALSSLVLAAAGLLAACFVPQAYCRYACPTGALLKWIRTPGPGDHFTRRDSLALACLMAALLWFGLRREPTPSPDNSLPPASSLAGTASPAPDEIPASAPVVVTGRSMGTTWSLKIHDAAVPARQLQTGLQARFDRIENLLSTWRADTPVSRFNAHRATTPFALPAEVTALLHHGQHLAGLTHGAFDVTAGPLVKAWGFGPPPRPAFPPDASQLAALMADTGYQKLGLPVAVPRHGSLPDPFLSLTIPRVGVTKLRPGLAIDLTAMAEGYALDEAAAWLRGQGSRHFLLELGGELLAAGPWPTALDLPFERLTLTNAALSTSGTYRQFHHTSAGRTTHLIDPRTGFPVRHGTVSVSVIAPDSLTADSWATALNVLGAEAALPLATRLNLAARFVTEPAPGQLRLTTTPAWPGPEPATAAP